MSLSQELSYAPYQLICQVFEGIWPSNIQLQELSWLHAVEHCAQTERDPFLLVCHQVMVGIAVLQLEDLYLQIPEVRLLRYLSGTLAFPKGLWLPVKKPLNNKPYDSHLCK